MELFLAKGKRPSPIRGTRSSFFYPHRCDDKITIAAKASLARYCGLRGAPPQGQVANSPMNRDRRHSDQSATVYKRRDPSFESLTTRSCPAWIAGVGKKQKRIQ